MIPVALDPSVILFVLYYHNFPRTSTFCFLLCIYFQNHIQLCLSRSWINPFFYIFGFAKFIVFDLESRLMVH